MKEGRKIMMNCRNKGLHYLLMVLALVLGEWSVVVTDAPAIQKENQAEKEANLKGQALGGLFNRWTFDQEQANESPADFSALSMGEESASLWTIRADAEAPSAPNFLHAESACQTASCYRLLVADKLQYEYPDVSVRLRFSGEGGAGQGGIVIGLRDATHFYAVIVDLAAKKLEVIRVFDGDVTVLGHTAITPKPVDWHSLRIQRNTIISKDVIEAFFDGLLVLSVQDQTLGIGQVGLLVRGKTSLKFDNLHAVPLFSQRPLSAPAAY
jgi:hypothetical protein